MAITIHGITNVDGDATKSYEFCGLSTDLWPREVDGKEIEVNSLFLVLDTGDFYYFAGDNDGWVKVGEAPADESE